MFLSNATANSNAFEQMDAMYRYQRYFYNATRKYYLLGRDQLIRRLEVKPGENILELGCGTARNLVILAKRNPAANFFGVDASAAMLGSAQSTVNAARLRNISLKTALADDFGYRRTFGLERPFDAIFFSYSISMIPTWRESIAMALENLAPGGRLLIVDFYDQKDLPAWFRGSLTTWLKKFHVQYWTGLFPYLDELEEKGLVQVGVTPIARRYAFLAELEKVR